jgi:hypothetical protein
MANHPNRTRANRMRRIEREYRERLVRCGFYRRWINATFDTDIKVALTEVLDLALADCTGFASFDI